MKDQKNNRPFVHCWPGTPYDLDPESLARKSNELAPAFRQLLASESIEDNLDTLLPSVYLPLAVWLDKHHSGPPMIVGLNGGQGTGKSTLGKILRLILEQGFGKRVEILSLDDLYLSPERRAQLAETVHPLFRTRGVPGTHDVELGVALFEQFRQQDTQAQLKLPVFDKASDRPRPEAEWPAVSCPIDILIFEGWCVGAAPQPEQALATPVNALEQNEDADGTWRRSVNHFLQHEYQRLFSYLDLLIMLKVPSMEQVRQWRHLQEQKLAASQQGVAGGRPVMDREALERFIMHYERLTLAQLQEMPGRADLVLELDIDHQVCAVRLNSG